MDWCVRTEEHDALLGLALALQSALHLTEKLLRGDFAQVHGDVFPFFLLD